MELPSFPKNIDAGVYGLAIRMALVEGLKIKDDRILHRGVNLTDKKGDPMPIDGKSFRSLSLSFFIDDFNIYSLYFMYGSNSEKIYMIRMEDVDRDTFKVLNLYYAQDKNKTFFAEAGRTIAGTNYKTLDRFTPHFEATKINKSTPSKQWMSEVVLNENEVYYRGRPIIDALPESFRGLGNFGYKDDKTVYFENGLRLEKIEKAHAPSFIDLGGLNATDKYMPLETMRGNSPPENWLDYPVYKDFFLKHPELSGYWYFKYQKVQTSSSTQEYLALGDGFFKKDQNIFYSASKNGVLEYTRILEINTDSFALLSHGYATNGKAIFLIRNEFWSHYKKLRVIDSISINTVEILSEAWVYDGSFFFYKGVKKFKADRASFTVLNHVYAYDKDGLICEGVRKKEVKIAGKIKVLGGAYLKIDGVFYYFGKSRKEKSIDDTETKLINDFIVMGADGSAFNHGKYRKYIGDFKNFAKLENGNYGDGKLEWSIEYHGLEQVKNRTLP